MAEQKEQIRAQGELIESLRKELEAGDKALKDERIRARENEAAAKALQGDVASLRRDSADTDARAKELQARILTLHIT